MLQVDGPVKVHAIGTPHGSAIPAAWERRIEQLLREAPKNTSWVRCETAGMPVAEARTEIVRRCLDHGADRLLFLDDDVVPPPATLRWLMEHRDTPIVSGIYWSKDAVAPQPVVFTERGEGPCLSWEPGSTFPIVGAGLGCCWIDMAVFRALPEPWFAWDFDFEDSTGVVHHCSKGEDLFFFEAVHAHGFQALCDSRILCLHVDRMTGEVHPDGATLENARTDGWGGCPGSPAIRPTCRQP